MNISKEQLHILRHSLGLDDSGVGNQYRNYYVSGDDRLPLCESLVSINLMERRAPGELTGGCASFFVTQAGKDLVNSIGTQIKKLSRGQHRYRAFLRSDMGMSFGEFLKSPESRNLSA